MNILSQIVSSPNALYDGIHNAFYDGIYNAFIPHHARHLQFE